MAITRNLGMGIYLGACDVKEGKNRWGGAVMIRIPQLPHVTP